MWLTDSSIGRKLVMSITGTCLVLFLLFHASMNLTLIFSEDAYNWICRMLGANWYALVGTAGLAVLMVLHFVFAFWLTIQNRKARGNVRYAVSERPKSVEWASQNMLVLGIIVFVGLLVHFANFWSKMQLQEIIHGTNFVAGQNGPTDGAFLIQYTFSQWYYVVVYTVWLAALWFHLSHGFWSMFQTVGWSGSKWQRRWQVIGNIYVTLVILGFLSVVYFYFFKSLC